jgi:hypothetical protein
MLAGGSHITVPRGSLRLRTRSTLLSLLILCED